MSEASVVLVTEDSDEDFETVREALTLAKLPYRLVRAVNGDECIKMLRDKENPLEPALVLLDLNMPGTGGREVLATLRGDEGLRALPIVVCSTSGNPRDVDYCYRAGANAFHVKPTHYTEHRGLMSQVLSYWLESVVLPDVP